MNEDKRLQSLKDEYLRRVAPIVKLLGDIEQFRRWSIEVDKEGNYTVMQCDFPPELQRIYDLGMETLKEMRVVYSPLVANAVANQEPPTVAAAYCIHCQYVTPHRLLSNNRKQCQQCSCIVKLNSYESSQLRELGGSVA